jgi:hypothetical protein
MVVRHLIAPLLASTLLLPAHSSPLTLHVVSSPANDVFALLAQSAEAQPFALRRHDSLDEALAAASSGDGLLALNDDAPAAGLNISSAQYAALAALELAGSYVEMPVSLPADMSTAYTPSPAWYFDRLVSLTNTLAPYGLPQLAILQAQGAVFQNYPPAQYVNASVLGYAHVAGSSTAVYGLPAPATLNPVLFTVQLPSTTVSPPLPPAWVGAIKLSCLVACRYTPVVRWQSLWNAILASVTGNASYASFPSWDPLVRPTGPKPTEDVRAALLAAPPAEREARVAALAASAFERASDWLATGSGLLMVDDLDACPAPLAPAGATVACMLEGFSSKMDFNGTQQLASDARMDCSAETAMALALRAWSDGEKGAGKGTTASSPPPSPSSSATTDYGYLAAALLNFTWLYSVAAQGPRANASDPSYGLLAWGVSSPSWLVCTYGDDNARVLGGTAVAASLLRSRFDTSAWEAGLLTSLLANLRIASASGFRPGRINFPDLEASGWEPLAASNAVYANASSPQPHYQAQMWAMFLWAYGHTGFERFYSAAVAGIADTMRYYPSQWRWTEYLSEEQARLILPLAWLVRADALRPEGPNATHQGWLARLTTDYLARQQPAGGVQEWFGTPGLCDACPPPTNDAYGDGEAPLTQVNGDTVTDVLYSNNYALASLVEAAAAMAASMEEGGKDAEEDAYARLGAPADALATYIAATQITSDAFPGLDGSWMRGFDYTLWDFWGSASDWGWGPWSVETGWTTTWMAAALAARSRNTSLWDLTAGENSGVTPALFAKLCPNVFPEGVCAGGEGGWGGR